MRILFGTEHDGLHINPAEPNGYEWWYFDAVSDDERYVLVVIFFCGTPMSPYYKAVADGKNPLPNDWCGVFVSLHERTGSGYVERTYAYNLYTGGDFAGDGSRVAVGGSGFVRDADTGAWRLSVKERGLWWGETVAELSFTPRIPNLTHDAIPGDENHTWVCVAPDCDVSGSILFGKQSVAFTGRGYHDHNFGRLPWTDTKRWYWDRLHLTRGCGGGAVAYQWDSTMFAGAWDDAGAFTETITETPGTLPLGAITRATLMGLPQIVTSRQPPMQSAPFYQRFPIAVSVSPQSPIAGFGIGELFEPGKLCGEIMSRALWTRIRRRS